MRKEQSQWKKQVLGMNQEQSQSEQLSPLEREIFSGKPTVTITVGDSMEPLLYSRSTRVVVVKADRELKANELPLYKRPTGQFVMHRIIRTDEANYYTRGDNRTGLEKVPKEWVLGVVTEIYRKKKHFTVENQWYHSYVLCWNLLYPIRWLVYKTRGRLRSLRRKKKD